MQNLPDVCGFPVVLGVVIGGVVGFMLCGALVLWFSKDGSGEGR